MTWAEFIEAGLLREYRREHNVHGRAACLHRSSGDRLGVPYPLAHNRPFLGDRQLVREAQDDAGLDADYCLVAEVRGQLVLTAASELFVQRVTWKDDLAARWRPHDDRRSPVAMDPRVRFGKPRSGASAPRPSGSTPRRARASRRRRRAPGCRLTTSAGRLPTRPRTEQPESRGDPNGSSSRRRRARQVRPRRSASGTSSRCSCRSGEGSSAFSSNPRRSSTARRGRACGQSR